MKVLIVSDYASITGGAELMMLHLRDELRQRGHDARMFSTGIESRGGHSFADYKCFGTESRYRTLLQTANPWARQKLSRVLREFAPDVVHVRIFLTQLSPLVLPLLRDVPSIYHVAWYRAICPKGTKVLAGGERCESEPGAVCLRSGCLPLRDWAPLMLQMKLFRRWRHHFDRVVANSHWVKTRLEAEHIRPVEVVHNGIPVSEAKYEPSSLPTVAFAGRLVREKGVDVLVNSFRHVQERLPDAKLLIAGDGPERTSLENDVQRFGLDANVRFLGHLQHDELRTQTAHACVHVVPSVWAEPFGLVAVEAMMRGIPVVASDAGGLAEIVQDGSTGLLVPTGDADRLGGALLQILNDPPRARQMGAEGHERAVKSFSFSKFVDRFVDFYSELAS